MPDDEEYQGWKNRETWAMALWLDNEQGLYNQSREVTREAIKNGGNLYDAEKAIKEWIEELEADACEAPQKELCKMFQDIGSLWRIDWSEVAESRFDMDELKKIKAEEERNREKRFRSISAKKSK
jgi:hypothetical protein